jgi:hypothetical protein
MKQHARQPRERNIALAIDDAVQDKLFPLTAWRRLAVVLCRSERRYDPIRHIGKRQIPGIVSFYM